MKRCARCKQFLSEDKFNRNGQTRDNLSCYCRSCISIINKEWRARNLQLARNISANWAKNNPERLADKALRRNYGISIYDKKSMLDVQDNKCAICGTELIIGDKNTHLDHNHLTGEIRGILCRKCNHLIGNCNEQISILESAVKYLTFVLHSGKI